MKLPYIDTIWRTRGTLVLDEPLAPEEAFERLAPLFDGEEVALDENGASLTYRKTNPAAQHRLATFSSGTLRFTRRDGSSALDYDVRSPALLMTFLAPLLFLALGQGIVGLGMLSEQMNAEAGDAAEEEEEDEEPQELHWIDQMLGAPAPEQDDGEEEGEEEEEENEDYSPDKAYGLAAVFALLYLIGRFLEPRSLRAALRRALERQDSTADADATSSSGGISSA